MKTPRKRIPVLLEDFCADVAHKMSEVRGEDGADEAVIAYLEDRGVAPLDQRTIEDFENEDIMLLINHELSRLDPPRL